MHSSNLTHQNVVCEYFVYSKEPWHSLAFPHGPKALSGIQQHGWRHSILCKSLCYVEFPIPTLEAQALLSQSPYIKCVPRK